MAKFKHGDLVVCTNTSGITNSFWEGILPIIGQYYTWRGYLADIIPGKASYLGYVEEIISPIDNGIEACHKETWYEKVEEEVSLADIMNEIEESIVIDSCILE